LRSGLQPLWRDHDTVQIGVDPRRAVAISGMREAADVIRLLDGSRSRDQIVADASRAGVPAAVTERVIMLLAAAGAIIDFPADALRSLPPELRRHLAPVLAAASLSSQDADGGAQLLARRSAATVHICGRGQIADRIADLLTRSGVAASISGRGLGHGSTPDLTVLVGYKQPEQVAELHRQRLSHLPVYIGEAIGVVGPLVQPGRTACLRCLDLARADRDPAWPLILAQLPASRMDASAGDPVLATAVAAQVAGQALAFAERSQLAAATANGTLELALPAWQWRRRTWQPHPACTCGASGSAANCGGPAQPQPGPDAGQAGDGDKRTEQGPDMTA
jgi:bacteriocin biosynthesis cyclodehydratase domain-containing protein